MKRETLRASLPHVSSGKGGNSLTLNALIMISASSLPAPDRMGVSSGIEGCEKSPSKGKSCVEYKRQGQERETEECTILPVAKYSHHKQAGINMDEYFYYKD